MSSKCNLTFWGKWSITWRAFLRLGRVTSSLRANGPFLWSIPCKVPYWLIDSQTPWSKYSGHFSDQATSSNFRRLFPAIVLPVLLRVQGPESPRVRLFESVLKENTQNDQCFALETEIPLQWAAVISNTRGFHCCRGTPGPSTIYWIGVFSHDAQ